MRENEEAKRLIRQFIPHCGAEGGIIDLTDRSTMEYGRAKLCAEMTVQTVIRALNVTSGHLSGHLNISETNDDIRYWERVKTEIDKL